LKSLCSHACDDIANTRYHISVLCVYLIIYPNFVQQYIAYELVLSTTKAMLKYNAKNELNN